MGVSEHRTAGIAGVAGMARTRLKSPGRALNQLRRIGGSREARGWSAGAPASEAKCQTQKTSCSASSALCPGGGGGKGGARHQWVCQWKSNWLMFAAGWADDTLGTTSFCSGRFGE